MEEKPNPGPAHSKTFIKGCRPFIAYDGSNAVPYSTVSASRVIHDAYFDYINRVRRKGHHQSSVLIRCPIRRGRSRSNRGGGTHTPRKSLQQDGRKLLLVIDPYVSAIVSYDHRQASGMQLQPNLLRRLVLHLDTSSAFH